MQALKLEHYIYEGRGQLQLFYDITILPHFVFPPPPPTCLPVYCDLKSHRGERLYQR